MHTQSETLSGRYRLLSQTPIPEIGAEVYIYEHIQTAAQVMYISNEDTNKVFTISFKTPPQDNTGCPHIMEHSVLHGSRHFPAKETFNELAKGSMKTFLNAFTGLDRTMYPIASTNDKDFINLMRVYLDAVFYPNVHTNPLILAQEGWHYEVDEQTGELTYNGVVYNEMKGAYSSPESILFRFIQQVQLPDTPYQYDSGGDPDYIPELTWDKFKAFHNTYYHPTNSFVYLYGKLDIEAALEMLDKDYLGQFERGQQADIPKQTPFAQPVTVRKRYPIAAKDNPEDKYYLSLNYACSEATDTVEMFSLRVLTSILMNMENSPLKLAILQSGLAKDSFAFLYTAARQSNLSFVLKHLRQEDIPALQALVHKVLTELVRDGIDKDIMEAVINSTEFFLREAELGDFPKGLYYNWFTLDSWLQGGNPVTALAFEPIVHLWRTGLTEPYFEGLITKYLLHNPHSSAIILEPEPGLIEARNQQLQQQLAQKKADLTDRELEDIKAATRALTAWQVASDTPEDLAKIPFLELSDIERTVEEIPTEVETTGKSTILQHNIQTNGIVYLNFWFDASQLKEEDLPWLSLYTDLVGRLDTAKHDFATLSNEINKHTGGINLGFEVLHHYHDSELLLPKLVLSGKAVHDKVDKLLELELDCLTGTVFEDKERIRQLLRETISRCQMQLLNSGHDTAINNLLGNQFVQYRWEEMTSGRLYYLFLKDLDARFAERHEELHSRLNDIRRRFFSRRNLVMGLTGSETDILPVRSLLPTFLAGLPDTTVQRDMRHSALEQVKLGLTAPINVQYCAKGGSFKQLGITYTGKLSVVNRVLRSDFLVQEIRQKGGAYGTFSGISRNGFLYCCSYRDPNLEQTLKAYDKTGEFLRGFQCSPREFDKFIIGTISNLDMPLTPATQGRTADERYLTGITTQDRQLNRDEVLSTTIEDVRQAAGMFDTVMQQNLYCVVGNEQTLKEQESLFDRLESLL